MKAFCPRLYGMYYVKLAVLLTLIGGSQITNKSVATITSTSSSQQQSQQQSQQAIVARGGEGKRVYIFNTNNCRHTSLVSISMLIIHYNNT